MKEEEKKKKKRTHRGGRSEKARRERMYSREDKSIQVYYKPGYEPK